MKISGDVEIDITKTCRHIYRIAFPNDFFLHSLLVRLRPEA
jgi:hypothetical protein